MKALATPAGVTQRSASTVPHLREASFTDHAAVCRLLRENGLEPKNLEEWRYRYEHNPALEDFELAPPIGWVLETRAHETAPAEIVGFLGNIPAVYELGGRQLRATIACDWAVAPNYRRESLCLLGRFFEQRGIDVFLTTTARQNSGPAFFLFGARKVPVENYDTAFFAITHRDFIDSFLRKKRIPAAGLLSLPLSIGLQAWDVANGRPRPRAVVSAQVKTLTDFDARFDAFWSKLRAQRADKLLATRTARQLAWHFNFALRRQEAWIMVYERAGEMLGYAVYYRQDNAPLHLKRMRLADLQALGDDPAVVQALLAAGMRQCHDTGVHMLEILGFNGATRRHIARFGFRQRKLAAWPFFYKSSNAELKLVLSESQCWDPCLYDGDGCL